MSLNHSVRLALGRFLKTMQNRMEWDVERLTEFAHLEFETIGQPTLKDLRR